MTRPELHETLTAMIAALDPPATAPGLRITEAHLDAPLELTLAQGEDGLTAYAAPPSTRFVTGFQNPVHRMQLNTGETRVAFGQGGESS
ncbi:MAG: hypothetical protein QNI90_13345 [Dinoroseobacter sp.]|nr:hypothetical protein [Dinoroseobacter sp.]